MKRIKLTQGKVALIDNKDFELVSRYKWFAHKGTTTWYARAHDKVNGGRSHIYMHRLLIKAKPGQLTDHRNGNGLDNRRNNLRLATSTQNVRNQRPRPYTKYPYKGVRKHHHKWVAYIGVKSKFIHLGSFPSIEEAAKAYDKAAKQYFGEFARTNF